MDTQLVGAFGEKIVEAELLRRGWRTANYNTSIKNAADYDLTAWNGDRTVQLRVKTCGPGWNAFQFSCPIGKELPSESLPATDYTILVRMGDVREDDRFYVIPTRILRKQINDRRREPSGDGKSRLDFGLCTLRLRRHRSGGEPGQLRVRGEVGTLSK
jgi:hypothetical protein